MTRERTSGRRDRDDRSTTLAGRQPVLEALKAGSSIEKIFFAADLAASKTLTEIRKRADGSSVPIRVVPKQEIDRAAGGINHQGVVAVTGKYRYADLNTLLSRPDPLVLFLDGVTDPHNLGSLLRSADGAGFHGIVIPERRSAGVTDAVRRVSAGASEVVPVARVTNLGRSIDDARTSGLWIVGLEADGDVDLWSSKMIEPPLGLVLGAEGRGLSRIVRERCDEVVSIPLGGRLGSVNVAVAGALAMFEAARRTQSSSL